MNDEVKELIHEMIRQSKLTRQQMVAVLACIIYTLEDTETNEVLRDHFAKQFGTYGLEGLDSLR